MRPLTDLERTVLVETIAHQIRWTRSQGCEQNDARREARSIVDRLEAIGVHGATLKRAVEKLMTQDDVA
jgi:hypothetical protein